LIIIKFIKISIVFFILLILVNALGEDSSLQFMAPNSSEKYCSQRPIDFVRLIKNLQNRLFFSHGKGHFGVGTCWWHSRFQRNATYLTIFRPDLKIPTTKKIMAIIKSIMEGNQVVQIPGLKNLRQFSKAYEWFIQEIITEKQIDEMFSGTLNTLRPRQAYTWVLRKTMQELYHIVKIKKEIAYVMSKKTGWGGHSMLVIDMEKIPYGYIIHYLDPNFPTLRSISYDNSLVELEYPTGEKFYPYIQRQEELEQFTLIRNLYCQFNSNKFP